MTGTCFLYLLKIWPIFLYLLFFEGLFGFFHENSLSNTTILNFNVVVIKQIPGNLFVGKKVVCLS